MSRYFARQAAPSGPPPTAEYCAESNAHEILGATGAMMGLAVVVVSLRLAVRSLMLQSVGWDDYVMLTATLAAVSTFVCFVGESQRAVGRHLPCISPADFRDFAKWQWAHSLVVMWGVGLVKVSIALFLMRLVPPGKKWKGFLWATIAFLFCFLISCSATLIWQCVPIDAAWDHSKRATAKCWPAETFTAIGLVNSTISCASDFLLALLPIPVVLKLQVNRRTKISLALVLSLGYFACAAGIVKAVKQAVFFHDPDPYWHNSFNVWNHIELCLGIVAASLPSLKPLCTKILSSTRSLMSGSQRSPGGSKNKSLTGYHRHHNQVFSSDLEMPDMKNSDLSGTTYTNNPSRSTSTAKSAPKRASRVDPFNDSYSHSDQPYAVAVTTGRDADDAMSWDSVENTWSLSEERLTQPVGIYKTTEIVKSTEERIPRRQA